MRRRRTWVLAVVTVILVAILGVGANWALTTYWPVTHVRVSKYSQAQTDFVAAMYNNVGDTEDTPAQVIAMGNWICKHLKPANANETDLAQQMFVASQGAADEETYQTIIEYAVSNLCPEVVSG